MNILLALLFMLIGCQKAKDEPIPADPPPDILGLYSEASGRLESMSSSGWVISRDNVGGGEHLGDSLIWTGLSLYALPCDRLEDPSLALSSMIGETSGQFYRYPSLKDQVSSDGALGVYRGLASLRTRCPDVWNAWRDVFAVHHAHFQATGGVLNDASGTKLFSEWYFLEAAIAYRYGLAAPPDVAQLRGMEGAMAAWALAVKTAKSACYRIHLAWLSLVTAEDLGYPVSEGGRNAFCSATNGTKLPAVDQYCGRTDLKAFVQDFKYNIYEYAHQRCPDYELPDANGMNTPALDLLVALRLAYKL